MEWGIKGKDFISWGIALVTGLVIPILLFWWGKKTTEDLKKQILDEVEERKKLAKEIAEGKLKNKVREAIEILLEETEEKLRSYFESSNEEEAKEKSFFLYLSFQNDEEKERGKKVLQWIGEARKDKNYQKLVERWNGSSEYNAKYDYDGGSLNTLMEYLKVLKGEKLFPFFF